MWLRAKGILAGLDFVAIMDPAEARKAAEEALRQHPDVPDNDTAFSGLSNTSTVGEIVNLCFETVVEQTLQQPTFVMDHPVEVSPLAKPHRSKPNLVERFELYIAGKLSSSSTAIQNPIEDEKLHFTFTCFTSSHLIPYTLLYRYFFRSAEKIFCNRGLEFNLLHETSGN